MAGPIAHILLALSIFPKGITDTITPDTGIKDFVLGSTFPDIRYISKNITREDTHFKNITLEEVNKKIYAKQFFQAGVLFHSLVDELRDWYMNKKSVYKIMPRTENAVRAIKFLEDNILYEKLNNLELNNKNHIIKYFDTVLDQELLFYLYKTFDLKNTGTNNNFYTIYKCKSEIKSWHKLMQTYCEKKMTPEHRLVCYLLLKYPKVPKFIIQIIALIAFWLKILPQNFLNIIKVIDECEKNEKLLKIINNFYDNFEDIYKDYQDAMPLRRASSS